jgi:hypothetical protein
VKHRDKYEHVREFNDDWATTKELRLTKDELRFSRRLDEGTREFEHFRKLPEIAAKYANGYSNGYVYTTAEHEDGECEQYGPGAPPTAKG